jgi:hypothetical protein
MNFTADTSTWTTTDAAGQETGSWGYDAYGTLAFSTPTSPSGYGAVHRRDNGAVGREGTVVRRGDGWLHDRGPGPGRNGGALRLRQRRPGERGGPAGLLFGSHICLLGHNPNGSCRGTSVLDVGDPWSQNNWIYTENYNRLQDEG